MNEKPNPFNVYETTMDATNVVAKLRNNWNQSTKLTHIKITK